MTVASASWSVTSVCRATRRPLVSRPERASARSVVVAPGRAAASAGPTPNSSTAIDETMIAPTIGAAPSWISSSRGKLGGANWPNAPISATATTNPATPPAAAMARLRPPIAGSHRLESAPSARLTSSSWRREDARRSIRLPTLRHAITSSSATPLVSSDQRRPDVAQHGVRRMSRRGRRRNPICGSSRRSNGEVFARRLGHRHAGLEPGNGECGRTRLPSGPHRDPVVCPRRDSRSPAGATPTTR